MKQVQSGSTVANFSPQSNRKQTHKHKQLQNYASRGKITENVIFIDFYQNDQLTCFDHHTLCVSAVAVYSSRVDGADVEAVGLTTDSVGEITGGFHSDAFHHQAIRIHSNGEVIRRVVGGFPREQDDISGALAVHFWCFGWAWCC